MAAGVPLVSLGSAKLLLLTPNKSLAHYLFLSKADTKIGFSVLRGRATSAFRPRACSI